MTWQQIGKLWEDYGPGAVIVLVVVILIIVAFWAIRTLIRWWPVITQFVSTINIIAKLPGRLDTIDSDNKEIATEVAAQHLSLKKMDARLISVESKAGIAADKAAVAAERADVAAAQLRHNGGSTIKDKMDKMPVTLDQIVALLQEMKADRPTD